MSGEGLATHGADTALGTLLPGRQRRTRRAGGVILLAMLVGWRRRLGGTVQPGRQAREHVRVEDYRHLDTVPHLNVWCDGHHPKPNL